MGKGVRILFCVEFYYPSVGGAQEVVRQLAERMVLFGHGVHVATARIPSRLSTNHNGVNIVEFSIVGNRVRGLQGEVDKFQEFLSETEFDVIMFYAAQQWTFDAAWPVMRKLRAQKTLVPCGYSGLFEPAYATYFCELPEILKQMDAVIYHAEDYRDINFAKSKGLTNDVIIPNGADISEFSVVRDPKFRQSISADSDALVLLTVGTMTGAKGHMELVQAYAEANFGERKSVLILNGNVPEVGGQRSSVLRYIFALLRQYGVIYTFRHSVKVFLRRCGFHVGKSHSIQSWAEKINREQGMTKRVVVSDYPRGTLIQAYLNSNLFVFASNVEYSPLVLYEACAAGLPFLSVPVGNAAEIVAWTGGGGVCDAPVDARGYTRVSPQVLARRIEELVNDPNRLAQLGRKGYESSRRRFNWDTIAKEYESLFLRLANEAFNRPAGKAALN